tara:strand:+ start:12733 stop:12984 length:252 start_codon:yes stop_codon:yes gene_type:complete
MTQFAQLVDRAATHGRAATDAPLSKLAIAKKLGISRAHLYCLIKRENTPRPHIQAKLVKKFATLTGLQPDTIKRRLQADWADI